MNLGKIKLVEICPACELCIRERLSKHHFHSYKSCCVFFSNGEKLRFKEDFILLNEIYDLERHKYVSTLENEHSDIIVKPKGRFEKDDNTDGYCIESFHRFK
jgi:hypothetical protein